MIERGLSKTDNFIVFKCLLTKPNKILCGVVLTWVYATNGKILWRGLILARSDLDVEKKKKIIISQKGKQVSS